MWREREGWGEGTEGGWGEVASWVAHADAPHNAPTRTSAPPTQREKEREAVGYKN